MNATITLISKNHQSYHGGVCTLITFKGEDGKSYRSWIYPNCGNSNRWFSIIQAGVGASIGGLVVKSKALVDADCYPKLLEAVNINHQPTPISLYQPKLSSRSNRIKCLEEMKKHFKKNGIIKT